MLEQWSPFPDGLATAIVDRERKYTKIDAFYG
jgi:hypothetical protein